MQVQVYPFVPAEAGTQGRHNGWSSVWPLDSRLRGNERSMRQRIR
jgi:hypothetical protein